MVVLAVVPAVVLFLVVFRSGGPQTKPDLAAVALSFSDSVIQRPQWFQQRMAQSAEE